MRIGKEQVGVRIMGCSRKKIDNRGVLKQGSVCGPYQGTGKSSCIMEVLNCAQMFLSGDQKLRTELKNEFTAEGLMCLNLLIAQKNPDA